VLGIEREYAGKPAGLRTHILVCAASALFVMLGIEVVEQFSEEMRETSTPDPLRIIQAIVVGISFLGAGTILRTGEGDVEGLTTAASILMTAAIGIAVAIQQVPLALCVTLAVALTLALLGRVVRRVRERAG
jgi:putative Mg2+ transporter-C (MgtC) family protein